MNPRRRNLTLDGIVRTWVELDGHGDALVLFLHGLRQSGNVARSFTGRTFDALAERGCTVVYPDALDRRFNALDPGSGSDDVGFLTELIGLYRPRRVIGCGFSNGGQMLVRLLFDAPGALHGIATFGTPLPALDTMPARPGNWVPTPVLSVHGTADPLVPYLPGERPGALQSAAFLAALSGSGEHAVEQPSPGLRRDTWSGGSAPVELWSVEGMGHVVPAPVALDERLGPGTDLVVGAELVGRFFSL